MLTLLAMSSVNRDIWLKSVPPLQTAVASVIPLIIVLRWDRLSANIV